MKKPMTTEEKLDRLTTVVERAASAHASRIDGLIRAAEGQQKQIDALIRNAGSHQDQIDAHNAQIEALIELSQRQATKNEDFDRRLASLLEATANLERQWQAYINTLPRQ